MDGGGAEGNVRHADLVRGRGRVRGGGRGRGRGVRGRVRGRVWVRVRVRVWVRVWVRVGHADLLIEDGEGELRPRRVLDVQGEELGAWPAEASLCGLLLLVEEPLEPLLGLVRDGLAPDGRRAGAVHCAAQADGTLLGALVVLLVEREDDVRVARPAAHQCLRHVLVRRQLLGLNQPHLEPPRVHLVRVRVGVRVWG